MIKSSLSMISILQVANRIIVGYNATKRLEKITKFIEAKLYYFFFIPKYFALKDRG